MHSLLEKYLAEVAAHLAPLPLSRRNEELNEVRQHLLNAIVVCREQGLPEDAAARAALEQFGEPESVGLEIAHTWRRGEMLKKRSFWGAAACTVLLCYFLGHLGNALVPTVVNSYGWHVVNTSPWKWIAMAWAFLSHSLAGGVSGWLFPKRAVAGSALGVAALFLLNWPYLLQMLHVSRAAHDLINLLLVVLTNILYVLVTVLPALVASRWQGRRVRLAQS